METVDMDLVRAARILAYAAHDGVSRKYHDAPYFVHPERVAKRAEAMGLPDYVVAACYCHDVDEDCDDYFRDLLRLLLPAQVVALVGEVTNPSKEHPKLRRHIRKAMDREHLKRVGYHAKVIKFLDRIDNIADMVDADRGFIAKYSEETMLLIDAMLMDETSAVLYDLAGELRETVTATQTAIMKKSLRM